MYSYEEYTYLSLDIHFIWSTDYRSQFCLPHAIYMTGLKLTLNSYLNICVR